MDYKLLEAFRNLFLGQEYLHRKSTLGDFVAMHFYEDLYSLNRSPKLVSRVKNGQAILNTKNVRQGLKARRGDGSFGETVPNITPVTDEGYSVLRGPIATIEIGIEVKILMKAMLKQIDRVINDLQNQARHFRSRRGNPICIGVVGINRASHCTSYEGDRSYRTDGRKHKHPIDEADKAEQYLREKVLQTFDEFLFLRFCATNEPPFKFSWSNQEMTEQDYGAVLVRVSQEYERRF